MTPWTALVNEGVWRPPYSRATTLPITLSEAHCERAGASEPRDRSEPLGSESACRGVRGTISIMKACELVGVSRRTIYNWIASGKVEYLRTAGGSVRIFVDTLWRDPGGAGELTRKEAS